MHMRGKHWSACTQEPSNRQAAGETISCEFTETLGSFSVQLDWYTLHRVYRRVCRKVMDMREGVRHAPLGKL